MNLWAYGAVDSALGIPHSGSRDAWGWLWFSCEMARGGKSLISIFQEFSSSNYKAFILAGGLGTGLSFYEV